MKYGIKLQHNTHNKINLEQARLFHFPTCCGCSGPSSRRKQH